MNSERSRPRRSSTSTNRFTHRFAWPERWRFCTWPESRPSRVNDSPRVAAARDSADGESSSLSLPEGVGSGDEVGVRRWSSYQPSRVHKEGRGRSRFCVSVDASPGNGKFTIMV